MVLKLSKRGDAAIFWLTAPLWFPCILFLCACVLLERVTSKAKRALFGPRKAWGRWFAWHPVTVDEGFGPTVWLETVERRLEAGETVYRRLGEL